VSLSDLTPDTKVQLYELDTTAIGYGDVFRFHGYETVAVSFNGQTYTPIPLSADGFEFSLSTQPEPRVTIPDSRFIRGWLKSRNYLRGAVVRRYHTLAQYVGLSPNPNYLIKPPEEFFINRPSQISALGIVFELRSSLDFFGVQFPGERIMKDEFPGVELVRSNT
jgi:lambda family phage minor tail protein L